MQSITCRFMHAAQARIAVSWNGSCISSSDLATTALSIIPSSSHSDPSRMDFMVSASSFEVTWLKVSVAALSHPFWYLILNVNLASDSTHWCLVASKLGVAMMYVNGLLLVLTMNGFQRRYSWNCSAIAHFRAKQLLFCWVVVALSGS